MSQITGKGGGRWVEGNMRMDRSFLGARERAGREGREHCKHTKREKFGEGDGGGGRGGRGSRLWGWEVVGVGRGRKGGSGVKGGRKPGGLFEPASAYLGARTWSQTRAGSGSRPLLLCPLSPPPATHTHTHTPLNATPLPPTPNSLLGLGWEERLRPHDLLPGDATPEVWTC